MGFGVGPITSATSWYAERNGTESTSRYTGKNEINAIRAPIEQAPSPNSGDHSATTVINRTTEATCKSRRWFPAAPAELTTTNVTANVQRNNSTGRLDHFCRGRQRRAAAAKASRIISAQ